MKDIEVVVDKYRIQTREDYSIFRELVFSSEKAIFQTKTALFEFEAQDDMSRTNKYGIFLGLKQEYLSSSCKNELAYRQFLTAMNLFLYVEPLEATAVIHTDEDYYLRLLEQLEYDIQRTLRYRLGLFDADWKQREGRASRLVDAYKARGRLLLLDQVDYLGLFVFGSAHFLISGETSMADINDLVLIPISKELGGYRTMTDLCGNEFSSVEPNTFYPIWFGSRKLEDGSQFESLTLAYICLMQRGSSRNQFVNHKFNYNRVCVCCGRENTCFEYGGFDLRDYTRAELNKRLVEYLHTHYFNTVWIYNFDVAFLLDRLSSYRWTSTTLSDIFGDFVSVVLRWNPVRSGGFGIDVGEMTKEFVKVLNILLESCEYPCQCYMIEGKAYLHPVQGKAQEFYEMCKKCFIKADFHFRFSMALSVEWEFNTDVLQAEVSKGATVTHGSFKSNLLKDAESYDISVGINAQSMLLMLKHIPKNLFDAFKNTVSLTQALGLDSIMVDGQFQYDAVIWINLYMLNLYRKSGDEAYMRGYEEYYNWSLRQFEAGRVVEIRQFFELVLCIYGVEHNSEDAYFGLECFSSLIDELCRVLKY